LGVIEHLRYKGGFRQGASSHSRRTTSLIQRLQCRTRSNSLETIANKTRNIEMIKLHFGEANIQSCNVMLKDIIESKRVDRLIHMHSQNVPPLQLFLTSVDHPFKDPFLVFLASIT
jgi:hypothetical protein